MSDSRSDIRAGGDLPARLEEEPPELPASYRRPGRDGDVPQPDNELFRLLVESAADYAIFALDPDGFVLSWNRGGERIKGYAAKEIIGKHFSIFYTDEAKSTGFPAYELEVTKREGRFVDEGWRVRKDGTQFWARVVISALRNASGEFIGFAKVTQDLTSRRESEQQARQLAAEAAAHKEAQLRSAELLALNEQLQLNAVELEAQTAEAQMLMKELELAGERSLSALRDTEQARLAAERARLEAEEAARAAAEANQAKSTFLAIMSHELRTPLNAIAGYAELIETGVYGAVSETQRDALARIQRSQRHLLSLINDVLNFARLEAGQVSLRMTTVQVRELLSRIEPMVKPQLESKRLNYMRGEISGSLEVCTDLEKSIQVLLNLLSNAIKFTPENGTIETGAERRGDRVAIWVRDDGVGIDNEKLESVFEPFVQVSRDLTSVHGGTGLGLAISRDLVRLMGGELEVESSPGEGSTFTVLLEAAGCS